MNAHEQATVRRISQSVFRDRTHPGRHPSTAKARIDASPNPLGEAPTGVRAAVSRLTALTATATAFARNASPAPTTISPGPASDVETIALIASHLRRSTELPDAFAAIIDALRRIMPLSAVVIDAPGPASPLLWISATCTLQNGELLALSKGARRYFDAEDGSEKLGYEPSSSTWPMVILPMTRDDGETAGVFVVALDSPPQEKHVAVIAAVARNLAQLCVRSLDLRSIQAAREHAEWAARSADLRVIEARRAQLEAEQSARALRVASEATALMLGTFDAQTALHQVARLIAESIANGCAIHIFNMPWQPIAHASGRTPDAVAHVLEPLAACVARQGQVIASARVVPSVSDGDAPSRAVAAKARRKLGADWIVSAPLTTGNASPLGVLTLFGDANTHPPVAASVVSELAQRAAIAITNGRQYAEARAAVAHREHVLSMVSHDLKNAFSLILMSIAHIRETLRLTDRVPTLQPSLDRIDRSAARMLKLVTDLLDASAIERGEVSMRPEACALDDLVRETIEEFEPQAKAAGITIRPIPIDRLPEAYADRGRIHQVLANLLSNAIKFTKPGGEVTVWMEAVDAERVAVHVQDTGIGIAPEHLPSIFDRFWRSPTAVGTQGAGLGLCICRALVERSGGRIWADSSPLKGTTLSFTLPTAAHGKRWRTAATTRRSVARSSELECAFLYTPRTSEREEATEQRTRAIV